MAASNDNVGDLLRHFYGMFGMPDEGPPQELNVTATIGWRVPDTEFDLLRAALGDDIACRQLRECRSILDDLATRLRGEGLIQELCGIPFPSGEGFEQLSSGVFWFALAASLDSREKGLPVTPFDETIDLPLPLKVQMTVHGSLVLRLYVALVYMREGILADLINESSRVGGQCLDRVKKLLNCDYVRRIRNALSHGSFSTCIAGIVFRDDRGAIVATPGFLSWLGTWLMLIQLQALAACARRPYLA
jgi:hypothetical protein